MSSSARDQLGVDDHQSQEETIEIKTLLKMLVQSQAKQTETQTEFLAKQTELLAKQAESQQQIIEILRSTISSSAGNNHKHQELGNSGEMVEIKELPNNIPIHSQATQTDDQPQENIEKSQTEQAKSDENIIQSKTPEILSRILAGTYFTPRAEEEVVRRAKYYPDRNDLLLEGDCQKIIEFLRNNPEALKQGVNETSYTVLHAAIVKKREMVLIEEIVKLMSPELLEYKAGQNDYTALHYAARYGNFEAVVLLVNKNPKLPLVLSKGGHTPLYVALQNCTIHQRKVAEYLYFLTKDADPSPFSGDGGAYTFCKLIEISFYDIALCLLRQFPEVAVIKSNHFDMCGLEMMVRKPYAFKSGAKLTWWQNLIYSLIQVNMNSMKPEECTIRDEENPLPENLNSDKVSESSRISSSKTYKGLIMPYLTRAIGVEHLYDQKLVHQQAVALVKQILVEICKSHKLSWFFNNNENIIKTAIKNGIIEFVAECFEQNERLIFLHISGEKMIEMAITERKETIVDIICKTADKLGDKMDEVSRRDKDNNTILHHAAKLAPFAQLSLVSGAALQMEREMQWYKGVESILQESDRFTRNKEGNTAQFIFTEEHKKLVKEGQYWLKDTSGSCMIVGTLIATVAFAAAFTVPGGNVSDSNNAMNGSPIFLRESSFTVFVVSDALALFSSITSVLMFLAIYTSRFAEIDFLKSLPQKLIFGLATLFVSMVAILVAFGASLLIVVGSRFTQALIPITLFGCCPLVLFAFLQLPLFVEMVRSTYWGSLFQEHRFIDLSSKRNENKSRTMKKKN
ncbi:hypothetical protein MKW98_021002 [Papaver atlanticum]|uniref:PGG domain-containing protein n=1 Tax=Papaver atlanticum TaxID=357466 RepID=A0AAD4SMV7_9MAGN|nr:hypothetical protein MKW98_021002 [Papaver atlanticum]